MSKNKFPTLEEQQAELKSLRGNGNCSCDYLRYLNGHWARADRGDCLAHKTFKERMKHKFSFALSCLAVIGAFGFILLLFWGVAETCGGHRIDSHECKDLMRTMETFGD